VGQAAFEGVEQARGRALGFCGFSPPSPIVLITVLYFSGITIPKTLRKQHTFLERFYFSFKNRQVFWCDNHKPIGLFIVLWAAFLDYVVPTIRYPPIFAEVTCLCRSVC
jgi:hypothetical protein